MKLEYRKYDLVSNYREYNMLWPEFEVFFQISPAKNQISADFMYIEIIPTIKFSQNITDMKRIYATHCIFSSSVKLKARKIWLCENKKGESIGSDSPF